MMLKVILYGYTQKEYSSRRIAKMTKENIPMMWLAGMQQPDHRTINEFRGERMPEILDDVFEQLLLQLVDAKLVDLEHIFVDGTKIEANANKYSFVWKKAINNFDEKLHAKAKALVAEVRAMTESEVAPLTLEEQLMKTAIQLLVEKLLNRRYLPSPEIVVADAGYASEQNYLYSIGEEKEPRFQMLVPYNTYVKEKTRKFKKDMKQVKNWTYLEEEDCYICPNNRRVEFQFYRTRKDKDGFKRDFKIYECEDCSDCPLKELCTKAKGNRQVHYNPVYEEMKGKAKIALEDETLAALYAQRKTDVESVFGNLKGNLAFTRFLLRGLTKVGT